MATRASRFKSADNGLLLNAIGLSLIINGHQLGAEIAPSGRIVKIVRAKKRDYTLTYGGKLEPFLKYLEPLGKNGRFESIKTGQIPWERSPLIIHINAHSLWGVPGEFRPALPSPG